MTVPTGLLKLLHHAFAVSVSLLLVIVATALLPPWLVPPVLLALILTPLVLGAGAFEGSTVRLLTRSRPPTEAEREVLSRVSALCSQPAVMVWQRRNTTLVQVVGRRRHTIVSPRLLESLNQGWVSPQEVAALVVHADAYHGVAAPRAEISVIVAELPWRIVIASAGAGIRAFGWLPLGRVAWQLRGVVAVVTLCQAVTEMGPVWPGVLGASVIALTYLVPAGGRVVRGRAELAGDRAVVEQHLGGALREVLQRSGSQLSLDRLERLRDQQTPQAAPDPGGRRLHVVRG